MDVTNRFLNWILFIALSIIWGSSFILMKAGMQQLTPYQVASIRMLTAGLILLPVTVKRIRQMPTQKLSYVVLSGMLGSFFPAFLFCIAETRIDSALAGILNALTPICVIVVGSLFFHRLTTKYQLIGVMIGFAGLCFLFLTKGSINLSFISYALLVPIATLSYGINVNVVNRHLHDIPSLNIASFAFTALIIPSFILLCLTGFFSLNMGNSNLLLSVGAASLLGISGTALATILFYILLKKSGPVFSSMVTYGIPFVSLFWGWLAGEAITLLQLCCLVMILAGVYISRR
jgi:drug/metabolite transporter (DMT)-like permease